MTLIDCYFHDNEMGILTSNDGVSNHFFQGCEFANNGFGDGYSHNIYVGHVNSFAMWFCYSHDAKVGHLVKSRAKYTTLFCNRLTGENGDGSYEIDLPNGGEALLIGNIIEQSANSQNGGIISFGLEGATNPKQDLVLSNNTVVNDRFDGRFVQFSDQTNLVKLANNLFIGPGQLLHGSTANLDTVTNIHHLNIANASLVNSANFDYHLTGDSPCINAGTAGVFYEANPLQPTLQYEHPLAYEMRTINDTGLDIGAFEFMEAESGVQQVVAATGFLVSPNPMIAGQASLIFETPLRKQSQLKILDIQGKTVFERLVPQGESKVEIDLGESPNGTYLIDIQDFAKQKVIKN